MWNWFEKRATPLLRLPTVTAVTMNAWEALENKLKCYLSLDQAREQKELHELSRYELAFLRDRFFVQCEDAAACLLPNAGLIQTRVERLRDSPAAKIDRFSDPFLATL